MRKGYSALFDTAAGAIIYAPTAGKRESGAPAYTFGGSARGTLGPVELGVTAKRTGGPGPRSAESKGLPARCSAHKNSAHEWERARQGCGREIR